jgi:hypothetical protein
MAVGTVSSVVNSAFVARFSGSGGSSSASAGNYQFSSADEVSTTLSTGTRTLTAAYQGLGQVIGAVNGSLAILEKLGEIAEDVVRVADSASRSTSSPQRAIFSAEYKRLGSAFKKVVEDAKLDNLDLLNKDDIAAVLTNVGLNPDSATAITEVLKSIITTSSEKSIADSEVKDPRSVRVPEAEAEYRPPTRYEDVFSPTRTIRTRGDAMVLGNDAKKLLSNLKNNISALSEIRSSISNNMDLVRATALAFRAESSDPLNQSATSAESLAGRIQQEIFKNASPKSLREAGNLDSIVSAALLYS